jgi:hypothetical protein
MKEVEPGRGRLRQLRLSYKQKTLPIDRVEIQERLKSIQRGCFAGAVLNF